MPRCVRQDRVVSHAEKAGHEKMQEGEELGMEPGKTSPRSWVHDGVGLPSPLPKQQAAANGAVMIWPSPQEERQAHIATSKEPTSSPLRVIDISRTLASNGGVCFCDPNLWPRKRRWDFHVLSHTWSKTLKEFSERIALSAGAGSTGQPISAVAYNEPFRNAHLQNEPCYHQFLQLLQLLRGDGVEYLWYDMLCINQSEKDEAAALQAADAGLPEQQQDQVETSAAAGRRAQKQGQGEKAQDIANMASYYRYNLGYAWRRPRLRPVAAAAAQHESLRPVYFLERLPQRRPPLVLPRLDLPR
ncbi:hypothetical protein L7F22_062570, partial [Adiantum nelumboides]|nr:hypothetical protein [Adiantum nelumboides]